MLTLKAMRKHKAFVAALPAGVWQSMFFLMPILFLCTFSFFPDFSLTNGFGAVSMKNYRIILSHSYLKTIINSLSLAYSTAILCFLFCFPIAYFIAFYIHKHQTLFLILFMLPSWTNFIIRIYSWFFVLRQDGFLAQMLVSLKILGSHDQLMANNFAIAIGMLHSFFPFMLLPLYSSLASINKQIIEASYDLGASKLQTLKNIVFPLVRQGASLGFVIVVISAFGEFAIPELLGGGKKIFWGNMITTKFLYLADYSLGSAAIVVGLVYLGFSLVIFQCISRYIHLAPKLVSLAHSRIKTLTPEQKQ